MAKAQRDENRYAVMSYVPLEICYTVRSCKMVAKWKGT